MSDFRASIKIEFDFMDKTETADMYINYMGRDSECPGLDDRVVKFFRDAYEAGMARYDSIVYEANRKSHEAEVENNERAELKRLKDKYEKSADK